MSENRLIDLEVRLSYQEDLINELNRIVAKQESRLTVQEERNRALTLKVRELTELLEEAPEDRKPPHY